MPYEQHLEKEYPQSPKAVYDAALKATEKLQGNVIASHPESYSFEVNFPKTILGKVLGERTYCGVTIKPQGEGSRFVLDAYPLDAVNRKLLFGARKGVTQTVVTWIFAHLEHNLGVPTA